MLDIVDHKIIANILTTKDIGLAWGATVPRVVIMYRAYELRGYQLLSLGWVPLLSRSLMGWTQHWSFPSFQSRIFIQAIHPVQNSKPQNQSLPSFSFLGQKVTSPLDWGKTSGFLLCIV